MDTYRPRGGKSYRDAKAPLLKMLDNREPSRWTVEGDTTYKEMVGTPGPKGNSKDKNPRSILIPGHKPHPRA